MVVAAGMDLEYFAAAQACLHLCQCMHEVTASLLPATEALLSGDLSSTSLCCIKINFECVKMPYRPEQCDQRKACPVCIEHRDLMLPDQFFAGVCPPV